MILISSLTISEQKTLFDKVISLKQKYWSNDRISDECNINQRSTSIILQYARSRGVVMPRCAPRSMTKKVIVPVTTLTDLSMYNRDTPHTRLFTDPNKKTETIKITPHFSTTKDFWLFR